MTQIAPLKDGFAAGSSAARAAIDTAFQSTFGFAASDPQAATISDSAMQSFLDGAFAAQFQDAGWKANWSNSSDANPAVCVSRGQTIHTDANANAPGVRKLAQAYAMMAAFGSAQLSGAARQLVARQAASLVSAGMSSLDKVAAGIGATQQRIDQANEAMTRQTNLIGSQIGALDNVDIAKVSVKINMITTQIQTAYSLTSRLRSLSLSQYLSG
jgi:flagellar hook-associated protein 3 FlgL